ncbi:hypothetical protein AB0M02_13200 [Actinoplanes sp. NPDC051861]|uniref:hypothetical protein n=1 Tax=Actinoplanes sp. NPDC051861 TaxID=3155170 RepID=UPI00341EF606
MAQALTRRPIAATFLLVTALLAGAAGCSGDDGPGGGPASDPKAAASPARAADGEVILPIDEYSLTLPQSSLVERARQMLVRECIQRFGFDLPFDLDRDKKREASLVEDLGVHGNKRRYGVSDMAAATKYGYHSPSDVNGTRPAIDVEKEKQASSSKALQLVVRGNLQAGQKAPVDTAGKELPKGGCNGEVNGRLSADGNIGENAAVAQIARDSYDRSVNDPAVVETFTKWSACMKAKGYDYPMPMEAGGEFDTASRTVGEAEKTAAKADVGCKREHRVLEVWQAYEVRFQSDEIDRQVQQLQAAKAERDDKLRRAAAVVGQGS